MASQIDVSVNAPFSGKITELLVEEDSTVSVGQDLLRMEKGEGESTAGDSAPKAAPEGGARSEPKDLEDGNKDTAAPEAGKSKGARDEALAKQDEKAPGLKDSKAEEPAPKKDEGKKVASPEPSAPASKPSKGKEEAPKEKVAGSRNETRVSIY
jgi:2-oxoglutarate dehydrogenase E2 component (dihydrolipoamide succinyltransferase)